MESAWVLSSPHEENTHLVVCSPAGASETNARVVSFPPEQGSSPTVVETTLLPADIRDIAWDNSDSSSPFRLVACSKTALQICDLSYRMHLHRVHADFKSDYEGELGAGVAWAKSGASVVCSRGRSVVCVNASTGVREWSYAHPATLPGDQQVASLAMLDPNTIVVGWSEQTHGNDLRDMNSLYMLDLRAPDGAAQKIATGPIGVKGLTVSNLEPYLLASFLNTSRETPKAEIFVWDVRRFRSAAAATRPPQPTAVQFRDKTLGPATLPPLRSRGLQWSPSKLDTLLAVDESGRVWEYRLWRRDDSQLHELPRLSWSGESSSMTARQGAGVDKADNCLTDVIAANWTHPQQPGLALAVRSGGSRLAILEQRSRKALAWNPRGGGLVSRPWPLKVHGHGSPTSKAFGARTTMLAAESHFNASTGEVAPILEDQPLFRSADICSIMRQRVEDMEKEGVKQQPDEFSRIFQNANSIQVPATAGSMINEAVAGMWHWVKCVDAAEQSRLLENEIATEVDWWHGAQTEFASKGMDDAEENRPLAGSNVVNPYSSTRRKSALHALGLQEDAPASICVYSDGLVCFNPTTPDVASNTRAVTPGVLKKDKRRLAGTKAGGDEDKENKKATVAAEGKRGEEDEDDSGGKELGEDGDPEPAPPVKERLQPVASVLWEILRNIVWLKLDRAAVCCGHLGKHCSPPASQLIPQLVLIFHAASCLLGGSVSNPAPDHGDVMALDSNAVVSPMIPTTGVVSNARIMAPHFEAMKLALRGALSNPHFQELAGAASIALGLQFVQALVEDPSSVEDNLPQMLAWRAPKAGGAGSSSAAQFGRPSVAFRAALAVRFLQQGKVKDILKELHEECKLGPFPDGICLTGLAGDSDSPEPITQQNLENLASQTLSVGGPAVAAPPAPDEGAGKNVLSLMRMSQQQLEVAERSEASAAAASRTEKSGSPMQPDEEQPMVETEMRRKGSELICMYVQKTGDVQTAALLFCHAAHFRYPPMGLQRYFAQYVALLTRWRLHRQRVDLHSLIGSRLRRDDETQGRAPVLYCVGCGDPLTGTLALQSAHAGQGQSEIEAITRICPRETCQRPTPACAVCLLPVLVIRSKGDEEHPPVLAVDNWVSWCQNCQHGGHMGHLEEWFETHIECPVAGCDCQCGSLY